jgi:anti-sigma factor RsiW
MTCARIAELLAAYADGGLEGSEHDDVATHVRGCPGCTEEVRVLREVLADTRRLHEAPARVRDEAFWSDLARDIRVAVAAEKAMPRVSWWRLPAVTAAFALAAAAVLWVVVKGQPELATKPMTTPAAPPVATPLATPVAPRRPAPARPLPRTVSATDLEDLEGDELVAVADALAPVEPVLALEDDDELALVSTAVAEAYLENLDDAALARVDTAL